jgi:RNA polymerase sigma factor (sigma-70 family)
MAGLRARRDEREAAALEIVRRHGATVMATARRYSATPEDAEDAYQRGLEILLTKAPTTDEAELLPWLRTVIKHEAFALRRQRERHSPVSDDGEVADRAGSAAATHEQAERWERLRHGAEAIRRLKPQELRALLLKAQGYSYQEICEITGWTYTKVNRCLTEGRRAFSERVEEIRAGAECERLAGALSALADGEATAEDLTRLRPHLKSCLACRTRLREFRAVPARVAALVPPAALAAGDPGGLRGLVESLAGVAQHKAAAVSERTHAAVELASAQKLAAVAASAAALAGGGTAIEQLSDHRRPSAVAPPAELRPERAGAEVAPPVVAPVAVAAPVAPAPEPSPPEPAPPAPATPADEFSPAAAPVAPEPAAAPAQAAFAPGGSGGPGAAGGGEFAP